jgi:ubiquinone/menaquinone biosynthesis C-methylase UbiE
MKLNIVEHLLLHNPLRPIAQNLLEARQLLRLGGTCKNGHVLEVGCGSGAGIDLILSKFEAAAVDAFDLDPLAVQRARRRHRRHANIRLWAGNIRRVPVVDSAYDAVFCFGVIHHVRRWRDALDEIYRVLTPGGRFYCEEITKKYITHPIFRRLLDHPQQDRFDCQELCLALERAGFHVRSRSQLLDLFAWVIADKPAAPRAAVGGDPLP